jgi:RES domain-containing protein
VYLADTLALAQLELLVHVPRAMLPIWSPWLVTEDFGLPTSDYGVARVEFEERLVTNVLDKDLPRDWRRSPWPGTTQELGDKWLREKSSPVLRLPSAVSPADFNYVLNPLYDDLPALIESRHIVINPFCPFSFDPRLTR